MGTIPRGDEVWVAHRRTLRPARQAQYQPLQSFSEVTRMAQLNAKAVLEIAQPADALFAVITDYAGRRRHIMPTAYHDYAVDSGEPVTKVRWVLHVGNHRRPYEMHVSRGPSERRVVERDIHSS
ncbi:MAG TPA: hypothetical protein VGP33_02605, partial [Chloroflexota bacterium]|nr:hypothetical protein [Chloroflexota bacterium]